MHTRYCVRNKTLIVDLGAKRRILSSAPRGGGLTHARFILNHQVVANPRADSSGPTRRWGDPARDLGKLAHLLDVDRHCVGLMTAVSLRQLVVIRETDHDLWVEGFLTVGVTNAVRAGERICEPQRAPGTINIILVTNASLTLSAMVGAVQVATEAKTGALLAAKVPSATGKGAATGTGTDAVVLACGEGPAIRYSGTHTRIGSMMARVVSRGVAKGLQRSVRWQSKVAPS